MLSGRVGPGELFDWAVARRAGVVLPFRMGVLEDYVARGYQLEASVPMALPW